MEWGQGGVVLWWSGVKVNRVGSGLSEWRNISGCLTGMLIKRGFFYFSRRGAACINIENALERNELVIQEIVENC